MVYILPLLALFITWGCIANFMQNNLEKKDLLQTKGVVSSINIVFEQGTRKNYKYNPLVISLNESSEIFKLRDRLNDWFPLIQEKVHVGDTICIYTRTKMQSLLGWGTKNDIYIIEKNNTDILRAFVMQEYNTSQAIATLFFSLLFWIPYLLFKLKVINPK
jgi:hypothetical protein